METNLAAGEPPGASSTLRRKRLSDITNLATDSRVAVARSFADATKDKHPAPATAPSAARDAYISQLLKENNALMRALGERNKVIELSAAEIQNLRFVLQKLSQQNHQLAQANSQMIAERNNDKDRLKAFQHEMGCRQAVLKARNLELEEKKKLIRQLRAMKCSEQLTGAKSKLDNIARDASIPAKAGNPSRKRALRSQSLGPAAVNHQVALKEKAESSRTLSRRKSLGLKHNLCETNEDLFEIENVKFPVLSHARDDTMNEDSPSQVKSSHPVSNVPAYPVKQEVEEQNPIGTPNSQDHGIRRLSVGRPVRRAAEKVSSYKETPINVKMRRSE